MKQSQSRQLYEQRMHRVLAYIDAHLDEALGLERLAQVAAFSPFHFHRLFAAWQGERLGDYLRRRRLETAAARLIFQPSLSVLEVALSVGFGSSEAFARAFKAFHGYTPSAWRRAEAGASAVQSKIDQFKGNAGRASFAQPGDHAGSSTTPLEPDMAVRLETLSPVHIAYLRYTGPYGPAVNAFWGTTVYPRLAENGLLDLPRYGISHDDPSIAAASKCRYDACVEVAPEAVLSGGWHKTTLPGGRYAVLDYFGTAADIGGAWSALLRD